MEHHAAPVLPTSSSFRSVGSLHDGLALLASQEIDAVLLDLELLDSRRLENLEQMREPTRRVAVIVRTTMVDWNNHR